MLSSDLESEFGPTSINFLLLKVRSLNLQLEGHWRAPGVDIMDPISELLTKNLFSAGLSDEFYVP